MPILNRIPAFVLVVATGAVASGCAPLVSDVGPNRITVQARDAGPETLAIAEAACAGRGRKSFGPLGYRCVDAKNVPYCQQKAYVFDCNVAPDDAATTVAAADGTAAE